MAVFSCSWGNLLYRKNMMYEHMVLKWVYKKQFWVNRQVFCVQALALEPEEKALREEMQEDKKEQNHSNLPVTCFPPQNIITGGLHADCMLRNVEFDLFPSQISSSVQAFPSDGDSAQWRKQQGRRERNRGRALFQFKLLLRHQFKKDDVILCSFLLCS